MLLKKWKGKILNMVLIGFFSNSFVFAANFESLDTLRTTAKNFIEKNVTISPDESMEVKLSQMDSSLKLAVCTKEIEASFPKDANRELISSIELTCNGAQSWHTFLPVNVEIFTKVLVAKRTITAKESISDDDVELASSDRNRLYNGFFKDKTEVVGLETVQMIPAGTVLTKRNLQQPVLVHRNELIDLTARKNSVVVTMRALSKSEGRLHETIKAFNPSSKRTLDAIVTGSGKAEILS